MSFLVNLDLLAVGVTIAAIAVLGAVIFLNNYKSTTSRSFFYFALFTILYGAINYANYQITEPILILWLLRLTLFSAVWHAFSLFQLFYVFPETNFVFPRWYKRILLPWVAIASLLTLSPFVFVRLEQVAGVGEVSNPVRGPGIIVFLITVSTLVLAGLVSLFKKTFNSTPKERVKYIPVLTGTIASFSLIILFNVILPVLFNRLEFIPLAPVFIFPFIFLTSYSIIRHGLLDVKVVATEGLTFLLAIVSLLEVVLAHDAITLIFRISVFALVLGFGVLLIRSVIREIKQREQLQKLTKELADANEQLKALDKARADFITIASHQLRTPPATIKWYLSSILSGDYGDVPDEIKEEIQKADVTNNGLISLIDDLLNASRIERGKMEFFFEPVNLDSITQSTVDQLVPLAKMKNLKLLYTKPTIDLPQIIADREKIRQVINNFIDNAIKYTKEGSVTVTLSKTEDSLRLAVSDTGKGITPDIALSIFEKYTRGKDSATHSTGLGLGLYVAKIIVEQHHGKIFAESKGVGMGSTFIFTLPLKNNLVATTLDLVEKQNT